MLTVKKKKFGWFVIHNASMSWKSSWTFFHFILSQLNHINFDLNKTLSSGGSSVTAIIYDTSLPHTVRSPLQFWLCLGGGEAIDFGLSLELVI